MFIVCMMAIQNGGGNNIKSHSHFHIFFLIEVLISFIHKLYNNYQCGLLYKKKNKFSIGHNSEIYRMTNHCLVNNFHKWEYD
jgi:hypothetical protein